MAYVYVHKTDDTNKPFYIGISANNDGEYGRLRTEKGRNPYWNGVKNKHGIQYEILDDNVSWERAKELEQKYIKEYKERGYKLTNLTDGGEGTLGYTRTDNDIQRIKDSNVGHGHVVTVGGLINKLSQYDSNTKIYVSSDYRLGLIHCDNIVILENNMVPPELYDEYDTSFREEECFVNSQKQNCIVLTHNKKNKQIKKHYSDYTEWEKLKAEGYYDADGIPDEIEKELNKLENRVLDRVFIDNQLEDVVNEKYKSLKRFNKFG